MLRYLDSLGIRPDVLVTVGNRAPFEGPITVRIEHTDHQIGHALAAKILVESV
jgi:DtxR family Mn-dependent transcriptional regulator